jgi:hypothetical protein
MSEGPPKATEVARDGTKIFDTIIRNFAESLDSLLISLPNVMAIMERELNSLGKSLSELIKEHAVEAVDEESGLTKITLSGPHLPMFLKQQRLHRRGLKGYHLIHRSYLISLISQYDAFLGCLLREVYNEKPERLKASEKQFSFKDLTGFGSIEEARDRLVEREVDDVIRKSHEDQLEWVARELRLDAKKFIAEIPQFVEVAQRRHLFVHTDGVVSRQYLSKCQAAGVKLNDGLEPGRQLEVSKDYIEEAFEVVYSVGVKLGIAIWLNSRKGDFAQADQCANHLAFELLLNERYRLTISLLEYALSPNRNNFSEPLRRCQILNLAQAHKWLGDQAACNKILDAHDWEASADALRLGAAVLRDDFARAYGFVRKLAHDPEFKRESYYEWPIFKEIRKEADFITVFEEAYGESFSQKVVATDQKQDVQCAADDVEEQPQPENEDG